MAEQVESGSLFSGAGMLDEAVNGVLGCEPAWLCENDPAASTVLAHRFPNTPNLGDITAVDWSSVPPVRVLTGGFPCTDVSSAGQQAGLRPGTRSGLWSHMAYAIGQLRPELVVIENVRGLASASAHSDVEPCPWCVGDGPDVVALRALGAVLGDLAGLGFDAVWCGLRASDVGACHNRFRFVILACPAADTEGQGLEGPRPEPEGCGPERGHRAAADTAGTRGGRVEPVDVGGHGAAADGGREAEPGRDDRELVLLSTPRATAGTKGGPNQRGSSGDLMLPSVVALLPTPTATPYGNNQSPSPGAAVRPSLDALATELAVDWGKYEPAIRRHEAWLGRPAPHPTSTGLRGGKTLNPALSEWMMGWPAGWVTEVPGLTPNDQKMVCGNGVVPQQIQAGIRFLWPFLSTEGRAA